MHTRDGRAFRDLNKNGQLDPSEDPDRPIEERVEDPLARMTLEAKAGIARSSCMRNYILAYSS